MYRHTRVCNDTGIGIGDIEISSPEPIPIGGIDDYHYTEEKKTLLICNDICPTRSTDTANIKHTEHWAAHVNVLLFSCCVFIIIH